MKLKLSDGGTYGYGSDGKRVCTGSQMGRRNILPDNPYAVIKLRLEKLKWVDGDYDQGGAYWGHGTPIWCGWNEDGVQVFVRARSRELARKEIRDTQLENVTFYR